MAEQIRIAQIGIAHTHATKAVVPEARELLERLDVTLVGIHAPDAEMLAERGGREVWRDVTWLEEPETILDD